MRIFITAALTAALLLPAAPAEAADVVDVPVECQPIMRDLYSAWRDLDGVQATASDLYARLVVEETASADLREQLLAEHERVERLRARIERIRARR